MRGPTKGYERLRRLYKNELYTDSFLRDARKSRGHRIRFQYNLRTCLRPAFFGLEIDLLAGRIHLASPLLPFLADVSCIRKRRSSIP